MRNGRLILQTALIYTAIAALFAIPVLLIHRQTAGSAPMAAKPIIIPRQTLTPVPTKVTVSGKPVKLTIPRIDLTLPIINGTYNPKTQGWTLTDTNAQFATVTSEPNNDTGNTLIYGHDIPEVFYRTNELKKGDILLIQTANNHILQYTYTGDSVVNPSDTAILAYQGAPQVTLLTCSGWFSTSRRLMYFKFIQVDQ